MVDIFSVASAQMGEFFAFKKVGDKVQGTYTDFRFGVDGFGNDQVIYILKEEGTGKIWNVAFKKTATIIVDRMKGIRFGQIVGFSYDEDRPNKIAGRHPAKIIRLFADPQYVDTDWLEKRREVEKVYGNVANDTEEEEAVSPMAQSMPEVDETTEDKTKEAIIKLAITKGLVPAASSVSDAILIIESFTGMKLTPEKYTEIIVKLSSFSS